MFIGSMAVDYAELTLERGAETPHSLTGIQRSLLANRISYVFGLRGPSLAVDTGQSSSLVAVHLAAQSLLAGDSPIALAGGVQLNLAESGLAVTQQFGALSPDGRCYTFDARANGYVRGEGGAVVVLKRLSDARMDGDRVYGVILGSAVNNDGGGPGLTVPSRTAQEAVIRAANIAAGVPAGGIGYVELHGTGTPTGDPIEAAALGAALGRQRPPGPALGVGSVKTNIGHLEGASGIAGFVKTVLSVAQAVIPPSLNFRTPNPAIDLSELNLEVIDMVRPWPGAHQRRFAGISSFGVGGTNCHVVIGSEEPVPAPPAGPGLLGGGVTAWPVSGRTPAALRDQAARLAGHATARPEVPVLDLARSLAGTRSVFESRAVLIAADRDGLIAAAEALAAGGPAAGLVQGTATGASEAVFVFPGQGTQWPAMALDLLDSAPVFAERMQECDRALAAWADWSVIAVLRDSAAPEGAAVLERIEMVQPVLFAVMVSLAALWQACGVRPAAVVGASQGEIAAACVAGALTLDDAAGIVVVRGRLLAERMAGQGAIASVAATEAEVRERLSPWAGRVSVSGRNGPRAITVAGANEALMEFVDACRVDGVRARIVPSTVALHCPEVDAIRDEFFDRLAPVTPRAGEVPIISTVSGGRIDGTGLDLEYWYRNAREPVDFTAALRTLLNLGQRTFLEVSPHPVLTVGAQETFEETGIDANALISLRRNDGGPARFAGSLAEAHVRGVPVDWSAVTGPGPRATLPGYAFQRRSYWLPARGPARTPVAVADPVVRSEPAADPAADSWLAQRLAGLAEAEAERMVLDLVAAHTAVVAGLDTISGTRRRSAFKDLGFDSAMTVELRNRLSAASGLELSTGSFFEHSSPAAMAAHLRERIIGTGPGESGPDVPAASTATDPIAIVGMACRYPGGVRSPEDLWRLVDAGVDAIGPFPDDRGWDLDALFDPAGDRPGTSSVRSGGFLDGADEFDPAFFGISPREATAMDPQQRLLLELSWEACERARLDPLSLRGTRTGVFTGVTAQDYGPRLHRAGDGVDGYALTGSTTSVASGRVAYVLGLEGPALSIDTACSSSLVAVHLAARALRSGECSLALAGGACVMPAPGMFVEFSRQHGLALDGRCKPFAAGADGTAWAEGAGVLVLERLSDARRNGHPVLALLRGSAINQDGASNGLTAPNGGSQRQVIRQALADAGLGPADVDALEAHGTGTALGDPIEAEAILATYGQDRSEPLRLGSLKSNIGHSQAAAGVGGVIKMVMALQAAWLPQTLHVDAPSDRVDWSAGAVELLSRSMPWPETGRKRRAAVSSFGISGTNSHVVLEAGEPVAVPQRSDSTPMNLDQVVPLVLAARGADVLRARAGQLAGLATRVAVADLGAALAAPPSMLEHRAVVLAGDATAAVRELGRLRDGQESAAVITGTATEGRRTVFVFPGQGAQWIGMALPLLRSSPVFAARMHECAAALAPFTDWSLMDLVQDPDEPLDRVDTVQPVLWAVMVSLAQLWRSVGVVPDAVVGHSQGEIAAATVAGVLSLTDGARIVALRSQAIAAIAGTGAMAAVPEPRDAVLARIARWGDRLAVAAINGPRLTVVSGDAGAVEELVAACEAENIRARRIEVDYASHCAHVEPLREELLAALAPVSPVPGRIAYYSSLTGARIDDTGEVDAGYWYRNLRETVRFADAVAALGSAGHDTFVEVSPHPVLVPGIRDTLGDEVVVTGTLRRDSGGPERFLLSAAELHVRGVRVQWSRLSAGLTPAVSDVELPPYPFRRQRFWLAPDDGPAGVRSTGLTVPGHPLLDAVLDLAGEAGSVYLGSVSVRTSPWLAGHLVDGRILLPGTAFVELAGHAARMAGVGRLDELVLRDPLVLPADRPVRIQVTCSAPDENGHSSIAVHARDADDQPWTCHATAVGVPPVLVAATHGAAWPPPGAERVPWEDGYQRLADRGYGYAAPFQGLQALWQDGGTRYAEVAVPEDLDLDGFAVHPALLDAALHAVLADPGESGQPLRLPFSWSGVQVHALGADRLRVRLTPTGPDAYALAAFDTEGQPVLSAETFTLRSAELGARPHRAGIAGRMFRLDWLEVTPVERPAGRNWALVTGRGSAPGWAPAYADLADLADSATGHDTLLIPCFSRSTDQVGTTHLRTQDLLALLQEWTADPPDGSRLAVITRGAVSGGRGEDVTDLPGAALWGLVRSAQSEFPGRIVLIDLDGTDPSGDRIEAALATGEPQLAIRGKALLAARLVATTGSASRVRSPWTLAEPGSEPGGPDAVTLSPAGDPAGSPAPGTVRIAVRAVGLNFRDVMIAMNMYPGSGRLGCEASGVVLETGPGVDGLAPGDRVMGIFPDGVGSPAVIDARYLAPVPAGWTFTQAAAVPIAFLTAYHALVDLAGLKSGESLLVHAATGGVGLAALQLARHLGAEVLATASPAKWSALHTLGIDDAHIASSRDLEFESRFRDLTGGVNVVLNSLAREYVDASVRLLRPGGRFIEMGKTDLRDPGTLPGVDYRSFDLLTVHPDRIREIFGELLDLFAACALSPPPVSTWDVREMSTALKQFSRARHVGKLVLTVPAALDRQGTVLITGGTGALGGVLARHLAEAHGIRHLLLTSRRGEAAPGAGNLVADLAALGVRTTIQACDVADPEDLAAALALVPAEHPLTAVVHAAGMLADATLAALTPQKLHDVLRPKVDGAWQLHRQTRTADLAAFVLFSSVVGVLGSAGQANYAAANAFLDGLGAHRYATGAPVTTLDWGLWAETGEMTGGLTDTDRARFARAGTLPLPTPAALALFDAALAGDPPVVVAAQLDLADEGGLPLLSRLRAPARAARTTPTGASTGLSWPDRLTGLTAPDGRQLLLDLVRTHAAVVLGHDGAGSIDGGLTFKDLGFDSLASVELRNRLSTATGLRLPATLLFDDPTPADLARTLTARLRPETAQPVAITAEPAVIEVREPDPIGVPDGAPEPIAVVGIGCRFPGADDPEEFWRLLASGTDAVGPVPPQRWAVDRYRDTERTVPTEGGFLRGPVDGFDSLFFGISPREAQEMDPQQRLFLEVAWEALEDAGMSGQRLGGSRTGVFASSIWHDYADLATGGLDGLSAHSSTGRALNMVANRISYFLGLRGPSMVVDSACSSSLLAVHLACQSLLSGESDAALVGGVNLLLDPATMVALTRFGGLSPDGRCKTFAAAADGFGRGEGCGVVVLKRLSDALAAGDDIRCLIRGSAANNDGLSNGLTAPSRPGQEDVLREAYRRAAVDPGEVHYVEAHGTGTSLGDPIEAAALGSVLGRGRGADRALVVGSVKTNIGHLEAAAGISGMIKVALALQHDAIPASLHFDEPNPHIAFGELGLRVAGALEPWPEDRPRIAGVSSFGWGGTNVHVVLSGRPVTAAVPAAADDEDQLLTLSAKTPAALGDLTAAVTGMLAGPNPPAVAGLARAAHRRARHPYRLAVVGRTAEELRQELAGAAAPVPATGAPGRIAFVFPGQGSQWLGMGRELLQREPVFRAVLQDCDVAARRYVDWSIRAELEAEPDASNLDRIDVVQPVLFAVEVALAALWRSWGVQPDMVIGHSMGEIAAAHVSGALDLDDAARIACLRSRLLRRVSGQGAMLSVELTEAEADAAIAGHRTLVSVAVSNSRRSTVLSGDRAALSAIADTLRAREVFCRWVKVDVASHSPQMDPLRADLLAALAGITPGTTVVPMASTVTGEVVDGARLGAAYWVDNLREPVRFGTRIESLLEQGIQLFVEMSPHPILLPAIEQVAADAGVIAHVVPSMRRRDPERATLLRSLGRLFVLGGIEPPEPRSSGTAVRLPAYPWQRERFWHPAGLVTDGSDTTDHVLLGRRLDPAMAAGKHYWQRDFDIRTAAMADHRIGDQATVPGAAYVEMALGAAAETLPGRRVCLADVAFHQPLIVPDGEVRRVQTELDGSSVRVFARPGDDVTCVAEATIVTAGPDPAPGLDVAAIEQRVGDDLPGPQYYRLLAGRGINYGPAYQGIDRIRLGPGEALARIVVPLAARHGYEMHPAFLDAALQCALAPLLGELHAAVADTFTSAGIARVTCHSRPVEECLVHAVVTDAGHRSTADVTIATTGGTVIVEVRGMVIIRLAGTAGSRPGPADPAGLGRSVRDELSELPSGPEQQDRVRELVRVCVGRVVKLAPERIDDEASLKDLGVDSVMSMELRNRLERDLGVTLSATMAFNYPTVSLMAAFLVSRLGLKAEPGPVAVGPAAPFADEPAERSDQGPDEDPAAALARELAELSLRLEEI